MLQPIGTLSNNFAKMAKPLEPTKPLQPSFIASLKSLFKSLQTSKPLHEIFKIAITVVRAIGYFCRDWGSFHACMDCEDFIGYGGFPGFRKDFKGLEK